MRSPARTRQIEPTAGTLGTARVARRSRDVIARVRPGDIAVVDHLDMDRATAEALVDAGVAGVVDASAIVSGRFPNLGPQVLVDAGIAVVDGVGPDALAQIRDGRPVRLDGGSVLVADRVVASGRHLDPAALAAALDDARAGLASQLAALTHDSAEVLRREQDLLLHGRSVPRLATHLEGRAVVLVADGSRERLRGLRGYVREQRPEVVAVGTAADAARAAGLRPAVVVLSADDPLPAAETLRAATDVVLCAPAGASPEVVDQLGRLGVTVVRCATGLRPADAALAIVDAAEPAVVVGVGLGTTVTDLLDRERRGAAGSFLARLAVGSRLVDAAAVEHLYAGRVRAWHLVLVLLAGLAALAAALAVTPVGQEWADQAGAALTDLYHRTRGLLP